MAAVTDPKLGVKRGWALGAGTTGDGLAPGIRDSLDANFMRIIMAANKFLVKSRIVSTPPGSPADGDCYVVGPSPTGAWVGKTDQIAGWDSANSIWAYVPPYLGAKVYSQADTAEYTYNGSAWVAVSAGGVTSVGLALPVSLFQVTNSPITTSGTISGSLIVQNPNKVLAGPVSGADAVPTMRLLVADDIPALPYVPSSEKGVALGVATLDAGTKIPLSQLPDSILGAVNYQGTWNASTNTPSITTGSASSANDGWYYKVSTAGTTTVDGISEWAPGDWIISNGTAWEKVDNSELVTSVAGRTGAIVLTHADIGGLATVASTGAYADLTGKPTIPANLSDLSDVQITSPADDDVIRFDTADGKWKNVPLGGGGYTLPIATSVTLGGIKVGARLTINATTGVLDADVAAWADITGKPGNATTSVDGFMSASDKTKIDGIASGATNTPLASTNPAALGSTPDVGVGTTAARADHVHVYPTSAQIGAIPASEKGAASGVATLGADAKIPASQLPDSVVGAVKYKGTWNAATNTPSITTGSASSANDGWYYKVATAGNTTVDGYTDWKVGDWIISNGTTWEKVDNTESVSTVAGRTGAIVLVASDISDSSSVGRTLLTATDLAAQRTALNLSNTDGLAEGSTNQYHTAARVRAVALSGLSLATSQVIAATDTVLQALGYLQAQITGIFSSVNNWTKAQRSAPVTLTDAATISWDISLGSVFRVVLGGNRTLGEPTNGEEGMSGVLNPYQDTTGSRTLAYDWCFDHPTDGTAPTLSTGKFLKDSLAYIIEWWRTSTVTLTIASPCVVTWNGHGLVSGLKCRLTTTGALPTGLAINTTYYVIVVDANTIRLATTFANAQAGTAINTSGSQSGTHTLRVRSVMFSSILKAIR